MFDFFSYNNRELRRVKNICDKVLQQRDNMKKLSDEELRNKTIEFKNKIANKEKSIDELLPEAFAVCREAAFRSIGLEHFPVQIMGGIVLHQGRIAEMKTGEGKTLVVTLPAYLNALSGGSVHIVTVNDYLAKRDKEQMEKVFSFLGLSTGLIYSNQNIEDKQKAYQCDIVYGTNSEFCFDYLKDNLIYSINQKVQKDFSFCIIDEVDSVLIDETRTPLIISSDLSKPVDLYEKTNEYINTLNNEDFFYDEKTKSVWLSDSGVKKAEQFFNIENLGELKNLRINHHIINGLKAHFVLKKDINYIIKDNKIVIVDDFTGRISPGKIYSDGIHQAVEAKEGLTLHKENEIIGTITYQNYFKMYRKLSGMTGTAKTEENEFRQIYDLDVIQIPTNKKVMRIDCEDIVFKTKEEKWNNIVKYIKLYHKNKQPILVGTSNIENSEILSNMLKKEGIKHNVLNAKSHELEANIIAQAGKLGYITIATNMAGRGTDILLGGNPMFLAKENFYKKYNKHYDKYLSSKEENTYFNNILEKYEKEANIEKEEVLNLGGLVVIGTERYESRRIDNQLRGRSGRQGEEGKSMFILSLEDDLLRIFGGEKVKTLAKSLKLKDNVPISSKFLSRIIENSQKKLEGINFEARKDIFKFDCVINNHRETIYKDRYSILSSNNEGILNYLKILIEQQVCSFEKTLEEDFDLNLLNENLNLLLNTKEIKYIKDENTHIIKDKIKEILEENIINKINFNDEELIDKIKNTMLHTIDNLWKEHIENLNELKQGACLQAYANKNPEQIFTLKAYDLFENLIADIIFSSLKNIKLLFVNK